MNRFFLTLLGTDDYIQFASMFAMALIGVLMSFLFHTNGRNPNSDKSSIQFDLSFAIRDNLRRIATGIGVLFIALRFSPQLLGMQLNAWVALLAGLGIDRLALLIKKKKSFKP